MCKFILGYNALNQASQQTAAWAAVRNTLHHCRVEERRLRRNIALTDPRASRAVNHMQTWQLGPPCG